MAVQKYKNIKKVELHIVSEKITPMRLQEYGVGIFDTIPTKSALKKALKKGFISVNNKAAGTATMIAGGEHIELSLPQEISTAKKPDLQLQVLFEDDYLALIHKPAGLVVSGNKLKTVANALSQNLKPSSLQDACLPQPVHRLDFATSGILLTGKTRSSIRALNKMFEQKQVEKTYYAITIGSMKPAGTITDDVDDKTALSSFRLTDSWASEKFGSLNLVRLQPESGRRHQLRKHLAAISNPILGDKLYATKNISSGKGLYLHAFSLDFVHPFTGEKMHFQDELPKKFRKILQSRRSGKK